MEHVITGLEFPVDLPMGPLMAQQRETKKKISIPYDRFHVVYSQVASSCASVWIVPESNHVALNANHLTSAIKLQRRRNNNVLCFML